MTAENMSNEDPDSQAKPEPDSLPRHEETGNTLADDSPASNQHLTKNNDQQHEPDATEKEQAPKPDAPPGGFDDTPIPDAPPGYTVKFIFHRATALPMADLTYSSDPYFVAQLTSDLPPRHKEDPVLRHRSKVIWSNTNPVWEDEWIVANVPSSGFKLKVRLYDEDIRDRDDRLGNVHLNVSSIDENFQEISQQPFKIKKRMASKRAYFIRAIAVCMSQAAEMSGRLWMSVAVLGRTDAEHGGRMYTISPNPWSKHFSPLLGRIVGTRENTGVSATDAQNPNSKKGSHKHPTQRYNFEANQLQLQGPVPEELYHRYVEFRPMMKSMFTAKGVGGILLSKALHHQHMHVYNHSKSTIYGVFPEPSTDMTLKFLDFVHYAQGGRIFTYIITLDGLWRFTETGKEFGIDMLSKHTMHSDVSIYIAFSGEFFITHAKRSRSHSAQRSSSSYQGVTTPENHDSQHLSAHTEEMAHSKDPSHYQLTIDNDSGTYRPNAKLLPVLKSFLERNLPGLPIRTLDCNADKDEMAHLKDRQREKKKREGEPLVYTQLGRTGSFSSSDESRLDENPTGGDSKFLKKNGVTRQAGKAVKRSAAQMKLPRKELQSSS